MKQEIDLSPFRINIHSQCGEDFLIKKLFELMKINSGWLVEFGAWQGPYLSNTWYHLQQNPQFKTIQIESDIDRFNELEKNIHSLEGIEYCIINTKVEEGGENSLNEIFKDVIDVSDEKNIGLLSIDVDGDDVEIFNSLDTEKYRPAIVIIEHGKWAQERELNYLTDCFSVKGYNLVHVTGNFIFVDKKYGISAKDNVHQLMRKSGNPEYMFYFGIIDAAKLLELNKELPGTDIHARLAEPQIIEIETED